LGDRRVPRPHLAILQSLVFLRRTTISLLPVAWWADPRVAEVRREIAGFLERRMGNAYFGFKDPRTVRLMPMWHQIINELRLTPKIVFCLRKPAQVATLAQCS
jgi:hypothetical protein